jgi:hypothetical protein
MPLLNEVKNFIKNNLGFTDLEKRDDPAKSEKIIKINLHIGVIRILWHLYYAKLAAFSSKSSAELYFNRMIVKIYKIEVSI